ncbi:hypothetical protein ACFX5D_13470 [Flavobacterium sp. LB3P45]|uniref:Uncharacterized protein n=1 Tax=Flavobacterium fructosi TaxID=3230416 RepID=A0ABW6HPM5_9FLAO
MNTINFNQVGGFPLSTTILAKLQTAFSLFNALGNIVGELTIISGCDVAGTNVGNGVVYINGEVLEFRGGLAQTKVIIKEDAESLLFENGNSYPVVKTRYATFGTGVGAINWVDFKRGYQTKNLLGALALKADDSIVTAIADAVALMLEKLNTIEQGAEKNVQPNWSQADDTKDDFIKNKPSTISCLAKGTFNIGDAITADSLRTVTFADVGTNNYMVVGCMVSTGSNFDADNDVIWMVREKGNTSFKLTLREVSGVVQNLSFEYMLIPL